MLRPVMKKTRQRDRMAVWHEVREQFFPQWDRQRRWRCRFVADLDGAVGHCDTDTKTIKIHEQITRAELPLLLIHEIAHAASSTFHGKRWQERMTKAAAVAEQLNRLDLARNLREEVADYASCGIVPTATDIYQQLADVACSCPDLSFLRVVDLVRREYGFDRQYFLGRFRRAREVVSLASRDQG